MKEVGKPKYIFITGGVVSGLGKGITAASLGRLLINRGLRVAIQKLDAYINVDTSFMSPLEHGEIFLTDDGAECDVDVGHYERFLGRSFYGTSNWTMGKIYSSVIAKERAGGYNGKNVQLIPHVTNEVIKVMKSVARDDDDIVIVEVGGTVGDIEQMVYIEAIRQFRKELGYKNSLSIHVTLVPYLGASGEIKTKPTQASVRELSQMGIIPDIVVCRTDKNVELDAGVREKIALFCNLDGKDSIIHNKDCRTIYEVPILFKQQKFDDTVLQKLGLEAPEGDLTEWKRMADKWVGKYPVKTVAVVGKYSAVPDAYLSIVEAVKYAGVECGINVKVKFVGCDDVENVKDADAMILTNGDGECSKYGRENKIPCLGVGIYAKKPGRKNPLGLSGCNLPAGSKIAAIYGTTKINERFRRVADPNIVELPGHPFYITVGYHPEFRSRPFTPHPLFMAFINAAKTNLGGAK